MCVGVSGCSRKCGPQLVSSVGQLGCHSSTVVFFFSFETGSFTGLELAKWARLDGTLLSLIS